MQKNQEDLLLKMEPVISQIYNIYFKKIDNQNLKDDFINEGLLAVLEKINCFDDSRGKPSTFFKPYIMQRMRLFATKNIFNSTEYIHTCTKKIMAVSKELHIPAEKIPLEKLKEKTKLSNFMIQTSLQHYSPNNVVDYEVYENNLCYTNTPEMCYLTKEKNAAQKKFLQYIFNNVKFSGIGKAFFLDRWINRMSFKDLENKYHLSHDEAIALNKRYLRHARKMCENKKINDII